MSNHITLKRLKMGIRLMPSIKQINGSGKVRLFGLSFAYLLILFFVAARNKWEAMICRGLKKPVQHFVA